MDKQAQTWTPLPRPCLVCLTKKKLHHNDISPSEIQKDVEPVDKDKMDTSSIYHARIINNESHQLNTSQKHFGEEKLKRCSFSTSRKNDENVTRTGLKESKPQKCLSLKRAANFPKQPNIDKNTPPPPKQPVFKKSFKNNLCKEIQIGNNNEGTVTFVPAVKEQFASNSAEKIKTSWPSASLSQSNTNTVFSNSTKPKSNVTKNKFCQRQLAIQSTSKQSLNNHQSSFQKAPTSNQSVDKNPSVHHTLCDVGDGPTTEDSLTSCPLCLMEFPISWMQVQQDGHIATCLSETADDVIW